MYQLLKTLSDCDLDYDSDDIENNQEINEINTIEIQPSRVISDDIKLYETKKTVQKTKLK